MNTKKIAIAILLLCLCLVLPSFAAEPGQPRSIPIPQHGKLILSVPDTWKQSAGKPVDIFPTIVFRPDKGDDFEVYITPLWSVKKDPAFNKPETARSMIESDLKNMLPQAVEKKAKIEKIKGVYGEGYYFFLTDKAPGPGEYPYAVRAEIVVGDLLLSVTALTRSKNSKGITFTIKALQGARQTYE
ncbi:MAG: hypothetical protein A4E64_00536 [Syntrophorhabdus sp. PtaU1.Bin058]|nr:MAG: hypothetical protein A4E64_00536 [Syntrophorhabdus sp. PtaU1.Bin058]